MSNIPQLSNVSFRKDTYIFVEGKHNEQRFFIIREGFVKITRQVYLVNEGESTVVGPGEMIGVVSAMSQRSHIESAQALTDVVLLVVKCSQFDEVIQNNSAMAMKILQQFSKRVRSLNNAITSFKSKNTDSDAGTLALFQTGKFYFESKMYNQANYIFKRYTECYPDGEFAEQVGRYLKDLKNFAVQDPTVNLTETETENENENENKFLGTYKKNSIVFADGEIGHSLYIIHKGSVKITKIINGNEIILAILKHGDILGEMALLEDKPRSAGAVVLEDETVLMKVLKQNFEFMAKTKPAIINRLICMLSERIWFSYKQLANAMIKSPLDRAYNYLAIYLEKNNVTNISGMSFVFDFGIAELMKLAFIPDDQCKTVSGEILDSGIISLRKDKLYTKDVMELFKIRDYYKRINARQTGGGGG